MYLIKMSFISENVVQSLWVEHLISILARTRGENSKVRNYKLMADNALRKKAKKKFFIEQSE